MLSLTWTVKKNKIEIVTFHMQPCSELSEV